MQEVMYSPVIHMAALAAPDLSTRPARSTRRSGQGDPDNFPEFIYPPNTPVTTKHALYEVVVFAFMNSMDMSGDGRKGDGGNARGMRPSLSASAGAGAPPALLRDGGKRPRKSDGGQEAVANAAQALAIYSKSKADELASLDHKRKKLKADLRTTLQNLLLSQTKDGG